ncbi:MAG: M20/M25/M40 family metallo-hydrolase [Phycisphaerae bacterium]
MINVRRFASLVALALIVSTAAQAGSGKSRFTAEAYLSHIRVLASDDLGGRGPGQPGIEKAKDYIVNHLRELGLKPMGENGTFLQEFEVTKGRTIDSDAAVLKVAGVDATWKVGEDWTPLTQSADEKIEGPLAFAGYGIEAKDFEWNDYADFDVKDKVVLIFRYEPPADDPEAKFGGRQPSEFATFQRKVRIAADHDAKAVLIVNPPSREPEKDELVPFESARGPRWQIPVAHVKRGVAEAMLKAAGMPKLAELEASLNKDRKPASRELGALKAELNTALKPNKVKTNNVLALLPGDGSTDEIVVVGAHYDHLGTTTSAGKSVIYNGADDNASGTAGVLELARVISTEPKTHRNIVFMLFSGEELGLLGSKHFVEHPTFELSRVKAMFNLDMIGRFSQNKFVMHGIESGEGFKELVDKAADEAGVTYKPSHDVFGRSDHASFYRKDIPVLFPFTGTHKEYHQPEDDIELIDGDGATSVLFMSQRILTELANMKEGPAFKKDTGEDKPDEKDEKADAQRTMPGVRLGVMPGYEDDGKPGFLVESLVTGGAAEKAGILAGDRIMQIDDTKIKDIYGYMELLRSKKPGDVIEVLVERKGESKSIKVTLEAPPRRNNDR